MIGDLVVFVALVVLVGVIGLVVGILLGRRLNRLVERAEPGAEQAGPADPIVAEAAGLEAGPAAEAEPR